MAGDVRYAYENSLGNEDNMIPFTGTVTLDTTSKIAATSLAAIDPAIRLIAADGTVRVPTQYQYAVIGFTMNGYIPHPDPSFLTVVKGEVLCILARNCRVS